MLSLLPDELKPDYQALISHEHLLPEHLMIIKAADKISAYLKCQAEMKAGNTEFEIAAKQLSYDIKEMRQPEVLFFMESFVPNCGLTLDDLIKYR